jgi:hypothetical protein
MGLFPSSLHYINEARVLQATWAQDATEEAAHLAWIDSLLASVQGQPIHALQQATAATELLLAHGTPINKGRGHIVLADCALDLLELSHTPARSRNLERLDEAKQIVQPSPLDLLAQARTASRFALEVAQDIHDSIGAALARLVMRRALRLSQPQSTNGSGVAAVEKLLRTARRLGDPALLGRTEMALADELLAAGRPDAARGTYWRAMRRFEEYHLGGLAFWPRRILQEWTNEQE